jgi:urate oxidase
LKKGATVAAIIRYGKANVSFYRTYARPLVGLTPIPESNFTSRPNTLFAFDVDVEVYGDNFLPAYTEGDNSNVVPTDTMKNFIMRKALEFDGATLEQLLHALGAQFLSTYPQMESLRLVGRELPFAAVTVPQAGGGFGPSGVLFSRSHGDHATAWLRIERGPGGAAVTEHECGRVGFQLIKLTGSSFASFVRDGFTTLPERIDRPLFIYLDAAWRYADVADALTPDSPRYVAAEQIRDLVQTTFHEFVSMSIQHLIHEMGQRILARFPQLAEVAFEAQNRLWDTHEVSQADGRLKVYCDPRPPYGSLSLRLSRD